MLFSKELRASINKEFQEAMNLSGQKKDDILKGIRCCNELEQIYMKFLYCSMPLSDLADYPVNLYLSYVKHAIFLRENTPWGKTIPFDIFLNYVLFYRVNNENIEDCRQTFFDMVYKRVENKSMTEAAKEVNYWCQEQATYQATDERTASPLTVLRRAYGRCGEESTFTVTTLRSVGIPARQIYVPRWSHCDDNHAWVEVWCDGSWHYLGACEPEPVLDRGWFTAAASRAMCIQSKVFTSYINDEEVVSKRDCVTVINNLNKYADTKWVTVQIVDSNQQPVDHVVINLEVLNYSEYFPVITIVTDLEGKAQITLGLGSIHIHAMKDGRFINQIVDTTKDDTVLLYWNHAVREDVSNEDFDIIAPKDNMIFATSLTEHQKDLGRRRFTQSDTIRKQKESNFYDEEKAQRAMEEYNCKDITLQSILIKSKGNFMQIRNFLNHNEGNARFADKILMLSTLVDKDYTDITEELLTEHFNHSMAYKGKYPDEIFANYVLNPRVYFEQITNYRDFILNYFDQTMQQGFRENPNEIWSYIDDHISEMPEKEYDKLYTSPVGILQIKKGSFMSKKILFVAICRTLGIPARIQKIDLSIEYYKQGKFVKISKNNKAFCAKLILQSDDDTQWDYMQNWSIAVLREGMYVTLDLMDKEWDCDKLTLDLLPGNYRVITTNRMPNGNIFGRKYCFNLSKDAINEVNISIGKSKIADMLENIEIDDFKLYDDQGKAVMASDITKGSKNIIVWIEEGKEPTEHILNEMIQSKEIFNNMSIQIIFIIKKKASLLNATLSKTLQVIPNIQVYYDDFKENVPSLARRLYVDPDKLPLIIVTNKGLNAIYTFSGYNVGITDLIYKIVKLDLSELN